MTLARIPFADAAAAAAAASVSVARHADVNVNVARRSSTASNRQVACGLLLHPILSQRAVRGRQQRPLTSVLKQSSLHYLLTKTRKKKMNSRKASVGINTSNLIYCKLYVCHPRVARGSKFWDPTTRNLDPTQPNLVPTNFPDFLDPTRWDSRTTRDQSQNLKSCFV